MTAEQGKQGNETMQAACRALRPAQRQAPSLLGGLPACGLCGHACMDRPEHAWINQSMYGSTRACTSETHPHKAQNSGGGQVLTPCHAMKRAKCPHVCMVHRPCPTLGGKALKKTEQKGHSLRPLTHLWISDLDDQPCIHHLIPHRLVGLQEPVHIHQVGVHLLHLRTGHAQRA